MQRNRRVPVKIFCFIFLVFLNSKLQLSVPAISAVLFRYNATSGFEAAPHIENRGKDCLFPKQTKY
ncbi:MAG TPA: hypothetical protein DEP46_14880 [Blastocatellia bacterium]|nr:hypothetical protein [Blastocatellia bacterium]